MGAPSNWIPSMLDLDSVIGVGKLRGVKVTDAIDCSPSVLKGLVEHRWVLLTNRAAKRLELALEYIHEREEFARDFPTLDDGEGWG